ncbi:MAG TPA: hypothetical protein VF534_01735 [Paraburkholderia sp.]
MTHPDHDVELFYNRSHLPGAPRPFHQLMPDVRIEWGKKHEEALSQFRRLSRIFASDSVPNTLAGFKAAFFDASNRPLTEQDIFDAGVRSGMAREPAVSQPDDPLRQRVERLLVELHNEDRLSEGQCAKVLDIHRIEWRKVADESAAQICDQVAAQSNNHLFRSGAKICAGEIRRAAAPAQSAQPALPAWFDMFLTNVCELPDRNSPEDEPEAIVATPEELRSCALNAIEQSDDDTDYEALEREHLGDFDKRTGIYQWRDTGPLETGDHA